MKAKLRTLPFATYFPMIQRNEASIYLLGWGVPTFDAFYTLQSLVRSPGAGGDGNFNLGRFSNPQQDALIERIKKETDPATRNGLIEQALVKDHALISHIPLYNQIIPWAASKKVEITHRADNRIDWRQLKVNGGRSRARTALGVAPARPLSRPAPAAPRRGRPRARSAHAPWKSARCPRRRSSASRRW